MLPSRKVVRLRDAPPSPPCSREKHESTGEQLSGSYLFLFDFMTSSVKSTSPAHGTDIFGFHWNCHCNKCDPRRKAVHRLVDSFSQVPSRWIEELSEHRNEWLPLPMWGTLFIPKESMDIRNIKKLMQPIKADIDELKSMRNAGWQEVADTGIYAITFDDELLLGIHGTGYDFYSQHWSKLYDTLGYCWYEPITL